MRNVDLNELLKEVINEARDADIPVPFNIDKEVIINKKAKKRFGCCHKVNKIFQIEISEFVINAPIKKIKQTLAHEVIHTCDGCFNHGGLWNAYIHKMNAIYGYDIKRLSSYENLGIESEKPEEKYKYIIRCENCGAVIYRKKRSRLVNDINSFRCKCGGKLVLEQL